MKYIVSLVILLALVLAGCGGGVATTPTQAPKAAPTSTAASAAAPTVPVATATPVRTPTASAPASPTATAAAAATRAPTAIPAATPTPRPAATPVPSPTAGPKRGGAIRLTMTDDAPHLDWYTAFASTAVLALRPIYLNGLVQPEFGPDQAGGVKLVGALAQSWQWEGTTATFKLRQDVVWQDGTKFTSADALASFRKWKDPASASPRRTTFDVVDSIEAPDPYTLKMRLTTPSAAFMLNLASGDFFVVPKHVLDRVGNIKKLEDAVGTGPFVMKTHVTNVKYEFERNSKYWEAGKPYVDGVVENIIPDAATALTAFRTGQIDVSASLSLAQKTALEKQNAALQFFKVPDGTGPQGVWFNLAKKPFNDVNVRRAFSMALDRDAFVTKWTQGVGAYQGYIPLLFGQYSNPNPKDLPYIKRDVAKAKELMKQAGFPLGLETTIKTIGTTGLRVDLAVLAGSQLKEALNVDLKVIMQERTLYFNDLAAKNFDTNTAGFLARAADPDDPLLRYFHSKAGENYFSYSNPQVDKLIEQESMTLDIAQRVLLVRQAEALIAEDVPVALAVANYNFQGLAPGMKNYYPSVAEMAAIVQAKNMWFDK